MLLDMLHDEVVDFELFLGGLGMDWAADVREFVLWFAIGHWIVKKKRGNGAHQNYRRRRGFGLVRVYQGERLARKGLSISMLGALSLFLVCCGGNHGTTLYPANHLFCGGRFFVFLRANTRLTVLRDHL